MMAPTVDHPFLKEGVAEARAYQLDAVRSALGAFTLLVLPTGLGKTPIAWMTAAERLRISEGWILMVAPSNPLVNQHFNDAIEWLNIAEEDILTLTGSISPAKRTSLYGTARVIIATPQIIRNDVASGILSLSQCSLLIVDEAHHATGNHAAAQVGDLYCEATTNGLILACTASPGSKEKQVEEVCDRLGIERIITRRNDDYLVKPYLQKMDITEIRIPPNERITQMAEPLQQLLNNYVESLRRQGFLVTQHGVSMGALRQAQARISDAIDNGRSTAYTAARQNADAQRLMNLLYLLKGQSVGSALRHLERSDENAEADSTQGRFLAQPQIRALIGQLRVCEITHEKLAKVCSLVKKVINTGDDSRIIVFASWRDSVSEIESELQKIEGVKVEQFIGQSSRGGLKGMTQKQQVSCLQRFREGHCNVLVATSVGEEGLDVPAADRVIFYEPVSSEIRTIQRRGRTARHRQGDVFVLVSEDTRDEGVRHASAAREKRMHYVISKVRRRRRAPRIHPYPDRFIESFIVDTAGEKMSAAEFVLAEEKRLQPELGSKGHTIGGLRTDGGEKPDVPRTKIIGKSPATNSALVRPKHQNSITDYLSSEQLDAPATPPATPPTPPSTTPPTPPATPPTPPSTPPPTPQSKPAKWSNPILNAAIEAAEDNVQSHIEDPEEGQNGEEGKV
ncbi:MAG: DEAD/DEAH box helicase [Euryarchaeota archaeon]|jgi:Fanconi anemia group M protein|nr:DEAD/DEAH box helicase [Euryarchaeota archaeon]